MTYEDSECTGRTAIVGTRASSYAASCEQSCRIFAGEFARLGLDAEKVVQLFRSPFYVAPYRTYQILGEEKVSKIVRASVDLWGKIQVERREVAPR